MTCFIRLIILMAFFSVVVSLTFGDDDDPTRLLDQRLQSIAGNESVDCGRVRFQESSKKADQCVRKAISGTKAFHVRYDHRGIDSDVAVGLAGDGDGDVFWINFDALGFTALAPTKGLQLLDNGHSIVKQCPKPIHLRTDKSPNSNGLTCFPLPDYNP